MDAAIHVETLSAAPDPANAFQSISGAGCAFLDGRSGAAQLARYSFLCATPLATLTTRGRDVRWTVEGREERSHGSPFTALRSLLARYHVPPQPTEFPFVGGAVGYLGYDLGRHIERLPRDATDDLALPEMWLAVYDSFLAYDAVEQRVRLVTWKGLPGQDPSRAASRVERLRRATAVNPAPAQEVPPGGEVRSSFTPQAYLSAVRRAKEYIAAGDIYQVNLSQRLSVRTAASAPALFARLAERAPAPFSAYLDVGEFQVLSSSPERFLRLEGRQIETRPIKGTRPRGRDAEEDRRLAEELLRSEKDGAELAMIVDLERNDLGRVSEYGTVRVTRARALESFPTVHHLVATVEGTLHPKFDVVDLVKAAFPGGSITGCPKIRAMEIVDELEPVRRGPYTGAIGYFGLDGRVDLSIAIRIATLANGVAYVPVGGAIVADSDPEGEYQETMVKARGWLDVLGCA